MKRLAAFLRDQSSLLNAFPTKRKSPDMVSALLRCATKLAEACEAESFADHVEVVTTLVQQITVAESNVSIEIDRSALAARLLDQEAAPASKAKGCNSITIDVPVRFRRRGVETKLVVLDKQNSTSEPDAALIKALARAHEWFGQIVRGETEGIGAIARAERLDRSYVTRVVCLAFLAPEITKAMLEGRQSTELTARWLISLATSIPLFWADQMAFVSRSDS